MKTAKRRITQTTPRDSPGTLVFWRQESLVDDPPSPEICPQCDPPPFKRHNFDQYLLIAPRPYKLAEKSSISTNRKLTTRFQTSHRWTVHVTTKSPKGWHKTRFCYFFPVNFNFCRKKSAAKFLCVKTSSGRVVATSFLYSTVHRWIAGDVPIYLKFTLKVTHLRQKTPISTDFA